MKEPEIKTELPGPNAKVILERDKRFISPSYSRCYPLVIKKGEGCWVEDVDGNVFLDFTSGIAVNNLGHCHPRIVEAAKEQLNKFIHMSGTDFYYELQSQLAEKLSEIVPGVWDKKVFLCNSGTEAIESAIKLASYYTQRDYFISFTGSFHGRTIGSLSLTCSKEVHKRGFPIMPGVIHVPYGYCYRCQFNKDIKTCDIDCAGYIEKEIFPRISPYDIAAIFVEPIQGEGGYIVPPAQFHSKLRKLTKKYGILLIADEIQTGMGRTGKMLAMEHFDVEPDIICLAKGLASGFPLGAMIAQEHIMTWPPGAHANTFGGNPIACRAALETIDILTPAFLHDVWNLSLPFRWELQRLGMGYKCVGDVRGLGMMIAIEFITGEDKTPNPILRDIIIRRCFEKGLLLLPCGSSSIRFVPPLIVTKEEIDVALDIFKSVLKEN